METTFVGIDVSKDRLDVHVCPSGEAFTVSRDGKGLEELVDRLRPLSPRLIAIEATGGFETIAAAALAGAALPLAIVNPAQIRHFAQAAGQLAKTDPIDAQVIARFAEAVKPEPRPVPDEQARLLGELVARRRQIIEMTVAERQREHRTLIVRVRKGIERHIRMLEKELVDIDDDIGTLVRGSPAWRDKEDLLEPMLEDPKLTERLFRDEKALVRITPHMLFSVLLRRLRRELEDQAYVLDVDTKGKRIPVFEGSAVADMLSDKQTRDYLAEMLSSFARTNSGIIYWQERGTWHKRRFSDIDLDDMVELTRIIDPEMRPALYKRIADIALFLSGIFPEHAARSLDSRRNMFSTKHVLKDYEQAGKRFYHVAAQETDQTQWKPVLGTLAEKFTLARLALNSLSDRYVKTLRSRYFQSPAE